MKQVSLCSMSEVEVITSFDTYTFDFNWTVKSADDFLKIELVERVRSFLTASQSMVTRSAGACTWTITSFMPSTHSVPQLPLAYKWRDKTSVVLANGVLFLKGKEEYIDHLCQASQEMVHLYFGLCKILLVNLLKKDL